MAGELKIKMVAVGDGAVGKSCLVRSLIKGCSDLEYYPTVFDSYNITKQVDDLVVNLDLFDTAGQEDYDKLRPLSYQGADGFLLCFSLDNENSLGNVSAKWQPDVWHTCPGAPVLLVGTKCDLRDNNTTPVVSHERCLQMAKKLKAFAYVECSAITMKGISQLFNKIVKCAKKRRSTNSINSCCSVT